MRKLGRVAVFAVALLALASPGIFAAEPRESDPPREPEWARAIRAKFQRKVTFEFQGTPLAEAIALEEPAAAEPCSW